MLHDVVAGSNADHKQNAMHPSHFAHVLAETPIFKSEGDIATHVSGCANTASLVTHNESKNCTDERAKHERSGF